MSSPLSSVSVDDLAEIQHQYEKYANDSIRWCKPGCKCHRHLGKIYIGPSYSALHHRLKKYRGKAANQICVKCYNPAQMWAQIHTEDGTDIWSDYVPMCISCHWHYDKQYKNFKSYLNAGKKLSSEHRQAIVDGHRKSTKQRKSSPPRQLIWCEECSKSWLPATWTRHIRKYHEGGKWSETATTDSSVWCEECGRTWSKQNWQRHTRKYHKGISWSESKHFKTLNTSSVWCEECGRNWSRQNWGRHLRKYHEGGEW